MEQINFFVWVLLWYDGSGGVYGWLYKVKSYSIFVWWTIQVFLWIIVLLNKMMDKFIGWVDEYFLVCWYGFIYNPIVVGILLLYESCNLY